ncbi:hypothetical protein YC2023_044234 [Brassica napus]
MKWILNPWRKLEKQLMKQVKSEFMWVMDLEEDELMELRVMNLWTRDALNYFYQWAWIITIHPHIKNRVVFPFKNHRK